MPQRYLPRYFCSLDDPEAMRTWFVIDRRTGVPLMFGGAIRYFTRPELDLFLDEAAGHEDDPAV